MSESTDRLRDMSRRRFLAAGATVSATAVAGCNTVVNAVFGAILEDVNVVNDTDQRRAGTAGNGSDRYWAASAADVSY